MKKALKIVFSLLLLALALVLVPASHARPITMTVTISGQLSGDFKATVLAQVQGTASSLSGQGTDSPPPPTSPAANPGVCQFPLTGTNDGTTITLKGVTTQSSIPSFVGLSVTVTAVISTQFITFNIGPFTVSGTGTVAIKTA